MERREARARAERSGSHRSEAQRRSSHGSHGRRHGERGGRPIWRGGLQAMQSEAGRASLRSNQRGRYEARRRWWRWRLNEEVHEPPLVAGDRSPCQSGRPRCAYATSRFLVFPHHHLRRTTHLFAPSPGLMPSLHRQYMNATIICVTGTYFISPAAGLSLSSLGRSDQKAPLVRSIGEAPVPR